MQNEISVLIADDNYEFGNLLREYIDNEQDMRVIGIARDGIQAVEKIEALAPDVVVLDVIMPNLDGIGVLEKVNLLNLEKRPLFIMLSAIGQDVFVQKAIILGAEYYIVKPFNAEVLITRIKQLFNEKTVSFVVSKKSPYIDEGIRRDNDGTKVDLEVEVTNLMRDVGIPPHMSGYQYLREAIIQSVYNNKVFNSITKTLYPAVAERFNTSPQKVERAIRNAIESAWSRGNPDSIDSLFGYTINYTKGKPTNSEFIAMMADKIRINSGIGRNDD